METRKCSKCKNKKLLSEYYKQKSNKSGYQAQCKTCQVKSVKDYRGALSDVEINRSTQKNVKNNEIIKNRNFDFVFRWLKIFGKCIDCGVDNIRVLEFDHVRGEKVGGVKDLAGKTASIKTLKNEIRKCEIRCCNCHRIKTQDQFGWRTSQY